MDLENRKIYYSIVVPVFNEEEVIEEFHKRLFAVLEKLEEGSEIIFVNDGSTDNSLEIMKGLQSEDRRIKILDFSRNFGHQAAITAGMDHSQGKAVIIIDADLQDPPEVIPSFIEKWKQGNDVVYGVRRKRDGETIFKKATAKLFYRGLAKISKIELPLDAGDFRLLDRKVVDVFKKDIRERNRYIRGLTSWVGFKQAAILYNRQKRFAGKTKYPFLKMLKLALDGIISFSTFPLRIATYIGVFVALLSFLYVVYALLTYFLMGHSVPGWTSLIVALLFLGGLQLIGLGLIGEYIGRINEETKSRPLYIIKKIIS